MRRLLCLCTALTCGALLSAAPVRAAGWETLGTEGFVTNVSDPKYAADGGVPYVAFTEAAAGSRASVMVYSGGSWDYVGTNRFTAGAAYYLSLAVHDGVPYLAFQDDTQGGRLTVMRADGMGGWETVGAAGFSAGAAIYNSLAFDGDVPYVAYRDQAEGDEVCVRRFVAGSWQLVGAAGFSDGLIHYTSLAIYNNEPYVAFRDQGVLGGRARVMRFTGGAWQDVGAAGFSDGSASYLSLVFSDGEPYLAYQDNANGQRATVMRFTGGNWTPVGGVGFTADRVDHISLGFIDSEPYLSFMDWNTGLKITLLRYTGGNWEPVGAPGISDGQGTHTSLFAIDGEPYVGFRDAAHTNGATVRYYVFTTTPTVTTAAVADITPTTATSGGEVTDDGGGVVSARGVCWSTEADPDIGDEKTVDGAGAGVFESSVTGLSPNTTYFLRAYATNEEGTSYGDQVSFTTAIAAPTVTTAEVTNISTTGATCGGTVTGDGGDAVTARGVCWSTDENPQVGDDKTVDGSGLGAFVSTMGGLDPNTVYYVRAYATNAGGTGYGAQRSFTTEQSPPRVRTLPVVDITGHSATARGEVTADGGAAVTERGLCIGTDVHPTLDGYHLTAGGGSGEFSIVFAGLEAATTYYVRAYAVNGIGTTYGGTERFTTTEALPAVHTLPVHPPAQGRMLLRGRVTDAGGSTILSRGFCWSPAPGPTTADAHVWLDGATGAFAYELTEWLPNATYYVRTMAENEEGLTYGNQVSVETPIVRPTVATLAVGEVGPTTAQVFGRIVAAGGGVVEDRGVCWSIDTDPTLEDDSASAGSGDGSFEATMGGLDPGRAYWVRAYARNEAGLAYGESLPVVAGAVAPVVTTDAVSDVGAHAARAGGIVVDEGGSPVHVRGFCWSLGASPTVEGPHLTAGAGPGAYEGRLTELIPGQTYYLRAYATNGAGTAYGETRVFETDPVLPTVTTGPVQRTSPHGAAGGGEVTATGGARVTARGLCWSTEEMPTIADAHASGGAGAGVFVAQLANLAPNERYYVRAYASNVVGTAYGEPVTIQPNATAPWVAGVEVITGGATQIAVRAQVLGDGGAAVSARGVCWSQGADPTVEGPHQEVRGTTGTFTAALTGLDPSTRYHVRAYAINAAGTAYGPSLRVTTEVAVPAVVTAQVTNVTSTSARAYGMVVSDGGGRITERGVCWSQGPTPTVEDARVIRDGTVGRYDCRIEGLNPGTRYHLRCYAVNRAGVGYGDALAVEVPSGWARVRTGAVRQVTSSSAVCEGEVLATAGAPVLERGLCWGHDPAPTLTQDHTRASGALGVFTDQITGLNPGRNYYVRAYATTSRGTAYGEPVGFATPARLAEVAEVRLEEVGASSVSLRLGACDDGGARILDRGVCWDAAPASWPGADCLAAPPGEEPAVLCVNGLRPNTTYAVRGYVENDVGWAYGPVTTFRTAVAVPDVSTAGISEPGARSARCTGRLRNSGGRQVTSYGFCWSQAGEPTLDDTHRMVAGPLEEGATFDLTLDALRPATDYMVRAFAVNSHGVGYGAVSWFRTQMATPVVVTTARAQVEATWARVGGVVLEDGGGRVRDRGMCWSETAPPTVDGQAIGCGEGTGAFEAELEGLRPNARYRVRAYARNEVGTAYGEEIVLRTPVGLPSIASMHVAAKSATTAAGQLIVGGDGGGQITECGVCWSTRTEPTTSDSCLVFGDGVGTFAFEITGLRPEITYYVRPYATNTAGTAYGDETDVSCWETRILRVGPNPFAESAAIEFSVARPRPVVIEIFDLSGRRVRVLRAEPAEAGKHTVVWDGRHTAGTPAGSGVYFLRLKAAEGEDRRTVILLR